jgi:hypothetical protein
MSEAFHSTLPTPEPPTLGGHASGGASGAAAGALSLLGHAHDHAVPGHAHEHGNSHTHGHAHAAVKGSASALHHTIVFPAQPAIGVLMWSVAARLVWVAGLLLLLAGATAWALSGAGA